MSDTGMPSTEVDVERAIERGNETLPDSVEQMNQDAFDAEEDQAAKHEGEG